MANLRHFILFVLFALLIADLSFAQCVMCKAVGEESANQGGIGSGLNKGIYFVNLYGEKENQVFRFIKQSIE